MGYSTPSYALNDLFNRIDRGDLQLPDFQRSYQWDVDRIRSLIVTVLRSYPMGSLMALDTRGTEMRFRPRPVAGAPDTGNSPGMLLLDGQQRLTTLYHCMRGDGLVESTDYKGRAVRRRFYVDIAKAVSEDVMPDEAVFSVNDEGEIRSHFAPEIEGGLGDREMAIAAQCVPVSSLLDDSLTDFLFEMAASSDEAGREAVKAFYNKVVYPLNAYDVPVIRLSRSTARRGVGSIFAQVNTVGLQMDVFDLLTAVFASEDPDFHLHEDWKQVEAELRRMPALDRIDSTRFLTAVSLLVTARKGQAAGNREDILGLTLQEYRHASRDIRVAFAETNEFLSQRCIFSADEVPYTSQLIPLCVILALVADTPEVLSTTTGWDRLNRWFWSGVFGELYGRAAVTSRMAHDVDQVTAWLRGETDDEPKTVHDAAFYSDRLTTVGPDSGVYKGVYALLKGRGARDWRTASPFDRWTQQELRPVFAAIYPVEWCVRNGIDRKLADSAVNRTPMGKRTEVVIDGYDPVRYLPRIQSKSLMDDDEFDTVLATHDLDPELLHSGNVRVFLADRTERILDMIRVAIGRDVIRVRE